MDTSTSTKKVRKYTMTIDRALCIGAATCVALAPKAYVLDSEAKAVYLDTASDESDEALLDAAKGCPVGAIKIIDDTGKQIFP
jgi:ferredoxin